MIAISGSFRVHSVYVAEKAAYLTLLDKSDGSVFKLSHPLPLPKYVVNDALIELKGTLKPRVFDKNLSLSFEGTASSVSEKS